MYKGQSRPLVREPLVCGEIHGESGLDGYEMVDASNNLKPKKAVLAMAEAIESHPEPVTLIATGCLTNVALLLNLYPELLASGKLSKVVIMGGAIGMGNTCPAAEFNIQVDPEAAAAVLSACSFRSCLEIVPLEVTHTALLTQDIRQRIEEIDSEVAQMLLKLMEFFANTYRDIFNFDYPPLHDPCAVLCAIEPNLFKLTHCFVEIETGIHNRSAGRTNCDILHFLKQKPNAFVAEKMNVSDFWNRIIDAIQAASKVHLMKNNLH